MTLLVLPPVAETCFSCEGPLTPTERVNCATCIEFLDALNAAELDLCQVAAMAVLPFLKAWVRRYAHLPQEALRGVCAHAFDGLIQEGANAALRTAFDAAWFEAQAPAPSAAD